eukprot:153621-Pelagomonas_calceolata.AAC.1
MSSPDMPGASASSSEAWGGINEEEDFSRRVGPASRLFLVPSQGLEDARSIFLDAHWAIDGDELLRPEPCRTCLERVGCAYLLSHSPSMPSSVPKVGYVQAAYYHLKTCNHVSTSA